MLGQEQNERIIKDVGVRWVMMIFFIAVIVFSLFVSGFAVGTGKIDDMILGQGVMFRLNDEAVKNVDISKYSFPAPKKGEYITLTTILPEKKITHPVLMFNIYHVTVSAYLDGKEIYTYGQEIYEHNGVLGHEYFRIPLDQYEGKELKLVFRFGEKNALTSFSGFHIMSEGDSYLYMLKNKVLTFMTSMTFIVIGIVGAFTSLTRRKYNKEIRSLTWISMFAIGISLWMLCNDMVIFMFVQNFKFASIIEYYSIYITPAFVALYFAEVHENAIYRNALRAFAGCFLGFSMLTIVLQLSGVMHYTRAIPCAHYMMIGLVIFGIYTLLRTMEEKDPKKRVLVYGMIFMGTVVVLEILRYNIHKYFYEIIPTNFSFMPIGTLVFILSMVFSYSIRMIKGYQDRAEQQVLERLAYMDLLTNLYNRNKCEVLLDEMDEAKQDGCIISMDLNKLKFVNDTFGHAKGDELIKNFALLLLDTFQSFAEIGRMGGDEFVVFIPDLQGINMDFVMSDFEKHLQDWNEEHPDEQISVSYGYEIFRFDAGKSSREVYEVADTKMYEQKKKYKVARA